MDRPSPPLETQIARWRDYVLRHGAVHGADADELEGHLRDRVADLREAGLSSDEAFLVAIKRMGALDELSREFAREHSDRLWKQLVLAPGAGDGTRAVPSETVGMLAFALAAAIAIKLPELLGAGPFDPAVGVYGRNLGLFALPVLAAYFAWKRRVKTQVVFWLVAAFLVAGVFANAFPFEPAGATGVLTALHLPIALWPVVGVAYLGGDWRSGLRRMDFVRFTGEWFIYYVLIALGGGVLTGLTVATFEVIGLAAGPFVQSWLLPCGAMGAVVVAAWLVEAKQDVVENLAPVLTRLFTPLFTALLLAVVLAIVVTGRGVGGERDGLVFFDERDLLILFDALLILVLGLLLYAISARDPLAPPALMDVLQLLLVLAALVIDVLALAAIVGRISSFGFTANKTAALGMNLILAANLAWSGRLCLGFLRGRLPFAALERWQTEYLPVYGLWAAVVVIAFPPLFGFA